MDARLLDRIFQELDSNSSKIEKLSEVVYTNASTLSLVTKLITAITIFLILASLTLYVDFGKEKHKTEKPASSVSSITTS